MDPLTTVVELEALRNLKARYCRLLDTRDFAGWRALLRDDLKVRVAITAPGPEAPPALTYDSADEFVAGVTASLNGAATMHHCHTAELELTSATTATGVWAMEDRLLYPGGQKVSGAGHYHESYVKADGRWTIATLELTRTLLELPR
ncbi:nuclear transport factor 2 family protein [Nocardia sp. NPDC057227]|uniref:nuclear transport factor 2 family protein n=1 Tax=Nocardia sp. NPDC057227 TaxID=3346056 RepID=UPI0036320D94